MEAEEDNMDIRVGPPHRRNVCGKGKGQWTVALVFCFCRWDELSILHYNVACNMEDTIV